MRAFAEGAAAVGVLRAALYHLQKAAPGAGSPWMASA